MLLQFLAAFGNACGRSHYIPIEGDRHPPQIWAVLVGETAKARKGTSWGRIRQLLDLAAPYWARECSCRAGCPRARALIWQVRDPIIQRVKDKKTGEYDEEETDPGVADKRPVRDRARIRLDAPPHGAGGQHPVGHAALPLGSRRRAGPDQEQPVRTTGAMVTVVGHVTVEELKRYLTRTEMANGLANRFLFACVRRSKELPFGGGAVEIESLADRIADRLGRIDARGEQSGHGTDGAARIWVEVYPELSEGKPGMLGAVTARAEAQTLRLALAYALLDGMVDIEPEHLQAALAVWRYCDQSAAHLFGTALGDPVADEIRRALEVAPRRHDPQRHPQPVRSASERGAIAARSTCC